MSKLEYNPSIDGLRALAALAVLFFHVKVPGFNAGFLGVDVFFVISGFLVTSIISNEFHSTNSIDIKKFIYRRFRRLYPALIFLVIGYMILGYFVFDNSPLLSHVYYSSTALLYAYNYLVAINHSTPISHTWTLAVEMHFYIIWPLILLCLMRVEKEKAGLILLSVWISMTIWRVICYNYINDPWTVYFRTDTHSTGLVIGSLLAFINFKKYNISKFYKNLISIIAISLLVIAAQFNFNEKNTVYFAFTVAEVLAAILIIYPPKWLENKILVWIGLMSYGIYLWHYTLLKALNRYLFDWKIDLMVILIASLIMASISYYWIEKPFRDKTYEKR